MKNPYEVLRHKEMQLAVVTKEIEALKLVAPLLDEEIQQAVSTLGPVNKPAVKSWP